MTLSDELTIDNISTEHFTLQGYKSHGSLKMTMF